MISRPCSATCFDAGMTMFLRSDVLFRISLVLAFVATASSALAIEPGKYLCEISAAVGVTATGDTIELLDPPASFRLEAVNAPVTAGELQRGGPHRALDYYEEEPAAVVSASIDTQLFHRMTASLRSRDGLVYSQGENTIVFSTDGSFFAYGLAESKQSKGVAIYSGECSRS